MFFVQLHRDSADDRRMTTRGRRRKKWESKAAAQFFFIFSIGHQMVLTHTYRKTHPLQLLFSRKEE
jgi:hypothetical protein